ncbi:MAG: biotin/lipoyl-containing protein [Butyrivibrio sp.]
MEYVLKATMPGLVARVPVNVGDAVTEGEEVAVINCMKMECSCKTEKSGVVKEILVAEWDELEVDAPMVIIECNE